MRCSVVFIIILLASNISFDININTFVLYYSSVLLLSLPSLTTASIDRVEDFCRSIPTTMTALGVVEYRVQLLGHQGAPT